MSEDAQVYALQVFSTPVVGAALLLNIQQIIFVDICHYLYISHINICSASHNKIYKAYVCVCAK